MKKLFLVLLFITAFVFVSSACDIKMNIAGEKKEIYTVGEEFVINITVVYVHRVCEIELSDTRFTCEGLKIIETTEWKEVQPGTYTKEIKVKVLQDGKPNASLKLVRNCNNEGGFGVLKIKKTDK